MGTVSGLSLNLALTWCPVCEFSLCIYVGPSCRGPGCAGGEGRWPAGGFYDKACEKQGGRNLKWGMPWTQEQERLVLVQGLN